MSLFRILGYNCIAGFHQARVHAAGSNRRSMSKQHGGVSGWGLLCFCTTGG